MLVAGCASAPPESVPAPADQYDPAWYAGVDSGVLYRVDPAASRLIVTVRRAGLLRFLGHNHVLENQSLEGYFWVAEDRTDARADVRVGVAGFVVDPPALRAQAGPGFERQPPDRDIAATRANLLGPRVLDVSHYPDLTGQARFIAWTGPDMARFSLALAIKSQLWRGEVEADVNELHGKLEVSVRVALDHAELGLKPIGVLGGMISVAEHFEVRVELVAVESDRLSTSKLYQRRDLVATLIKFRR